MKTIVVFALGFALGWVAFGHNAGTYHFPEVDDAIYKISARLDPDGSHPLVIKTEKELKVFEQCSTPFTFNFPECRRFQGREIQIRIHP